MLNFHNILLQLRFILFSFKRHNRAFDAEHNLTVCENDFQTAEHILSRLGASLDTVQVRQLCQDFSQTKKAPQEKLC